MKTPISIGQCPADLWCRRIFLVSCLPVFLVGSNLIGASGPVARVVDQYCADCHNSDKKKGALDFSRLNLDGVAQQSDTWERVGRKLQSRQIPPVSR